MQYTDINQVIDSILNKRGNGITPLKFDQTSQLDRQFQNQIRDISYGGNFTNVYDKTWGGDYVMKYKNYIGDEGNENRLALQQGAVEKAFNGLTKNIAKVGLYALDATVGTVYGIGAAIKDGDLSSFINNDFSTMLDYANKNLDRNLPNLYTDEEKAQGILSRAFTNPMNFLFNDVAGGLAFIGGAVLPELALGVLTAGATVPTSLAKIGARVGVGVAKKVATKTGKELTNSLLRSGIRNGAMVGNKVGEITNTARFIAQSTFFEAGMEARHNFKDAVDTYMNQYQERNNGQLPSIDELGNFIKDAQNSSENVFLANTALLSVTNATMFGKAFGLPSTSKLLGLGTDGITTAGNRLIGLGTDVAKNGAKVVAESSRAQRWAGRAFYGFRKPISEGVVEEGLQGVFGGTMQNYLSSKYDPKQQDTYSLMKSFGKAFKDQYTTKEGWFEIGIGGIIGAIGGNVSGNFGVEGFGKSSYSAQAKALQQNVSEYNTQLETFRNMNRSNSVLNSQQENPQPAYQDVVNSFNFIKANEKLKGYTDMNEDYATAVNSIEFTEEQKSQLGIESTEAEQTYKTGLIEQFKNDQKQYKQATNLVERLGIDQLSISNGDKFEMKDALTLQIMLGGEQNSRAQEIGNQIEKATGINGIYSAMEFMTQTLNPKVTQAVENYEAKENQLQVVEQAVLDAGMQLTSMPVEDSRRKELAKKKVVLDRQLLQLRGERDVLEQIANKELNAVSGKFGEAEGSTIPSSNVRGLVDRTNALNDYISALKVTGKTADAKSLENMLRQYKAYAVASNELDDMTQRMLASDFFSTKEGKNLMSGILGDKYKPTQEFSNALNEAQEELFNAFPNLVPSPSAVQETIEKAIADNPNISEREKFRIESIIKSAIFAKRNEVVENVTESVDTTLNTFDYVVNPVDEYQGATLNELSDFDEITPETPAIVGDSIFTRPLINNPATTTIEELENVINNIVSQIDEIVNGVGTDIVNLQAKRVELEQAQADLEALQRGETIENNHGTEEIITENTDTSNTNQTLSEDSGNVEANLESVEQQKADIERRRQEELSKVKPVFHHTKVALKDFNFQSFQKDEGQQISQFGNGLNVASVTNSFFTNRYGKPIEGEVNDSDFIEVDANLTEAKLYDYFISLGYKINTPQYKSKEYNAGSAKKEYDGTEPVKNAPYVYNLFNDLQQSNPEIKGVKIINHIIGDVNVEPFYVIYDAKSFYGKDSLTKEINAKYDTELAELENNKVDNVKTSNVKEGVDSLYNDLAFELESEFGNETLAQEIQQQIETLEGQQVQQAVDESIEQATSEEVETEINEGDFAQLEVLAKEVVDGGNISTTENLLLIGAYPNKFNELLENEKNIRDAVESYNGTTVGENIETTEATANESSESIEAEIRNNQERSETINRVRERIDTLEQEIVELERSLKFTNSEAYRKYNDLSGRFEELNDQELLEFEALRDEINNWTYMMGVTTQDGVELTDLIEQLQALVNTPIENVQTIVEATQEEVDESLRIMDRVSKNNYEYGLNPTHVFATFKGKGEDSFVEIAGLTFDGLQSYVGFSLENLVEIDADKNTLKIPQETVDRINNEGKVKITGGLGETYTHSSLVLTSVLGMDGQVKWTPIVSDYDDNFPQGAVDQEALSNSTKGDTLALQVNVSHPYNEEILKQASEEMGGETFTDEEVSEMNEVEYKKSIASDNTLVNLNLRLDSARNITMRDIKVQRQIDAQTAKVKLTEDNIKKRAEEKVNRQFVKDKKSTNTSTYKNAVKNAQDEALSSSVTYKTTVSKLEELEASLGVQDSDKVKIQTIESQIQNRLDYLRDKAKATVDKHIAKTTPKRELSAETKERVLDKLRIDVVDVDQNNVQTLKGVRSSNNTSESDTTQKHIALRNHVANQIEEIVNGYRQGIDFVTEVPISVSTVLPGQPNYNLLNNEDGNLVTEYRTFDEVTVSKVEDIGYIQNGEVVLRNTDKESVNMSYLKGSIRSKSVNKTPFVVIRQGRQYTAFPVQMTRLESPVNVDDLTSIFNDPNINDISKAQQINTILAKAGIDITQRGNAMIVTKNGLNSEIFNNLVAEVQNKEYLSSVESWSDVATDVSQALIGNASINLNMSEPFLGQKLRIDLSKVPLNKETPTSTETTRTKNKRSVEYEKSILTKFKKC